MKRSVLTLPLNMVLEVLANIISKEKEIKDIFIRRGERKLSFADDRLLYIENPKESTKEALECV